MRVANTAILDWHQRPPSESHWIPPIKIPFKAAPPIKTMARGLLLAAALPLALALMKPPTNPLLDDAKQLLGKRPTSSPKRK